MAFYVVIASKLKHSCLKCCKNFEDQHEDHDGGFKNKEGEMIVEF